MTSPSNDANNRINLYWEKGAIYLIGLVLAFVFYMYQGQRVEIKELQGAVTSLQMNKISKEELREVENRLNTKVDAAVNSLAAMSAANKQDILQRIDYAFGLKVK